MTLEKKILRSAGKGTTVRQVCKSIAPANRPSHEEVKAVFVQMQTQQLGKTIKDGKSEYFIKAKCLADDILLPFGMSQEQYDTVLMGEVKGITLAQRVKINQLFESQQ